MSGSSRRSRRWSSRDRRPLAQSLRAWSQRCHLPEWATQSLVERVEQEQGRKTERPIVGKLRAGDAAFPIYGRMGPVRINISNTNTVNINTNVRTNGRRRDNERELESGRFSSRRRASSPQSSSTSRSESDRSDRSNRSDRRNKQRTPRAPLKEEQVPKAKEEPATPDSIVRLVEASERAKPRPPVYAAPTAGPWAPLRILRMRTDAFCPSTCQTIMTETVALVGQAPTDEEQQRQDLRHIRAPHLYISRASTRQDYSVRTRKLIGRSRTVATARH